MSLMFVKGDDSDRHAECSHHAAAALCRADGAVAATSREDRYDWEGRAAEGIGIHFVFREIIYLEPDIPSCNLHYYSDSKCCVLLSSFKSVVF